MKYLKEGINSHSRDISSYIHELKFVPLNANVACIN